MDSPSLSAMGAEEQRDRSRRGERGTRFSDNKPDNDSRDRSRERQTSGNGKRIYVSNIPYEYRWQDLKDLFRRMVGNVEFVELFVDENNKARGCGIVEFKDPENVAKALEVMHRYELNGREIVVKEDHGEERDKYGRIARGSGGGSGGGGGTGSSSNHDMHRGGNRGGNQGRDRDDDRYLSMNNSGGGNLKNNNMGMNNFDQQEPSYNTYGLSPSFLASLRIQGPLHNKIFVANLDYKVDVKKLKQVFKMAGRVISVDLSIDKEGNSRGFAVIEYDHPVEAVQAISMFDHQLLYDRRMTVRLDRIPEKEKLPEGLGGIGMGLGPNGEPLRNVALNLPSLQTQNNIGNNSNNLNNAPVPVAAPPPLSAAASMLGQNQTSNLNNLAALNNVVGNLNNLNPLLSLGLSTLTNPQDSNNSGIDISKMVGNATGVAAHSSSSTNLGVPNNNPSSAGYNNMSNLSSSTNMSNPYGFNNLPSGINSTQMNANNPVSYGSSQRDYELNNNPVRSYNTQNDDFNRMPPAQNFNTPPHGNGSGSNQSNARSVSDTIFIRNLPPNCTWQTLRDKFREIGEVKFAEIRGQDCGVVRFSKERDAELAIKLKDGSRFDGRTLDVSFF